MKLFPNFTSIPLDYLLISWVTNYTHNRGVLTCLSHRELLEHWNGLMAKVHIFPSEIMKKSCDKVLSRFDDFVFFVTDSKIHQTLNFYLKSTKANRSAKVIRVLLFNKLSLGPYMVRKPSISVILHDRYPAIYVNDHIWKCSADFLSLLVWRPFWKARQF